MKKQRCIASVTVPSRMPFLAVVVLALAVSGLAEMYEQPRSFALQDKSQEQVERKVLPKIDIEALLAEDRAHDKNPQHPVPMRFAVAAKVSYTLDNSGTWQTLPDGHLWRLRIQSPEAKNINLGITRFDMPEGTKLWIYDPAHTNIEGPYTARHRSQRGSLWTPIIEGDEMVLEVFVPTGVAQPVLEITRVNQGYRGLGKTGEKGGFAGNEGTCENDVVCSVGDPWRDQIRGVAVYTISFSDLGGGTHVCTGTLLNDIPHDGTPYFLSANHCLDDNGDPASIVVYWNFQSTTCGTHGPGSLADKQVGGATLRANYFPSDFALFQLAAVPDPSFKVFYAGWDASGSTPASTVGIHHPAGDVKAISFSNSAPQITSYATDSSNTYHWRADWDSGVTEGGSSGSCLFETTNHRCIGQLHGGPSACGSPIPSATEHDFYGMLSVSWTGGGTDATRLSNWLDPANTGTLFNDGDPHIITANGVHYNFQGAGEYVSLRTPGRTEIQTRESPVATTSGPLSDPYDGVASCVSLNTAVAARVGTHRVTYEPNLSGVPDPSGLQLRIDGALTTLAPGGQDLGGGGRILKTSVPGGLEVDFSDNYVLLVTPGWWSSQSKWYLNVDVVRRPATDGQGGEVVPQAAVEVAHAMGLMGVIPHDTWLPLLPNGASVGPMPADVHQRYLDLYKNFGDSWRVTDKTSLFDYAPGTSTATFTQPSWPPQNPPCSVPGETPVTGVDLATAEQACSGITGKNAHDDCIFDVRVTGNTGFAATYAGSGAVEGGLGGNGGNGGNGGSPLVGKLAAFLDLGAGFPHGTFSNAFNTGFAFNAGLEYMFNPHVSAEGIFGYHHFPGKFTGDVNVYQFSGNMKVYLTVPPNKLRPFVNGGIGAYKFSPGSASFGGNFGAGVLYELTSRFGLQGSYNFHAINTSGGTTRFSTLQAGIRFVF